MKSIKKESEFKALYKIGKKTKTEIGAFIIAKSMKRRPGIVINRGIGNAVERNRIKRAIKEAERRNTKNADIVLIIGKSNINFNKAKEDLVFAFNKIKNGNPGTN